MGFGVWGLGVEILDFRFRVYGLGFKIQGLVFMVQGSMFGIWSFHKGADRNQIL